MWTNIQTDKMRSPILKYDRTDALNKATELFWHKVYQGTKMRDLQEHMDMQPGSISICWVWL